MGKKSYEFVDLTLKKEIERRLEDREERETVKVFKICIKCRIRKSLLYFSIDMRSSDNRTGVCRACRSKEASKYYYLNRERILSENKEARKMGMVDRSTYYQDYREKNREHLQKIAKKWYKKNKKTIKKRNLKYYEEHKEECNQRRRLWIENNREKIRIYNREYKRKRS